MEKKTVIALVVIAILILLGILIVPRFTGQAIKAVPKAQEILDDSDIEFKTQGDWEWTAYYDKYHRTGYRYVEKDGEGVGTWDPWNMPGEYEVYAWWPQGQREIDLEVASPEVKYEITHKDGIDEVIVNQKIDGAQWNYLGTYEDIETVKIYSSEQGTVFADAIKLVSTYYQI